MAIGASVGAGVTLTPALASLRFLPSPASRERGEALSVAKSGGEGQPKLVVTYPSATLVAEVAFEGLELMRKPDRELKLRIVVIDPPLSVLFALRRTKQELDSLTLATGGDLSFNLTVRVRSEDDEPPNFLGDFVWGPRGQRHLGLEAGTLAGQSDSHWTRRAKIGLKTITWKLIEQVDAASDSILEAKIAGKAKDGGPACATVPLMNGGWRVVTNS